MTLLKRAGLFAVTSVFSYVAVLVSGDGVCPGYVSTGLIAVFLTCGLAALVFLVLGIVRNKRNRHAPRSRQSL